MQYAQANLPEVRQIDLCAGEITLSKDCDKFVEFILENGYTSLIASNGTIYKDSINKGLNTAQITLCISLDCGTQETFFKIKGGGGYLFDITTNNIIKYSENLPRPSNLILKYILIEGVNDNYEDVDGFISLANKCKCLVQLSGDGSKPEFRFADKSLALLAYFVRKLKTLGLGAQLWHFHQDDAKLINDLSGYKLDSF
jgi:adenine C2-methylase RlmN of 23S rRNA A2503 and tRNA A37